MDRRMLIGVVVVFLLVVTSLEPPQETSTVIVPDSSKVIVESQANSGYREFESLEELEAWVKPRAAGLHFIKKSWWDCDDFAERMQLIAIQKGYRMSLCPVYLGDVFGRRVMVRNWQQPYHMGNLTMIGNDIYYIEPQDGKIVWVMNRDLPDTVESYSESFPAEQGNQGKHKGWDKKGGKK